MANPDLKQRQLVPIATPTATRPVVPGALSNPAPMRRERNGMVYTKRWVVDLMLDLAGYTVDRDLQPLLVVEPAAGDGSFVLALIERLIASSKRFGHRLEHASTSLLAYELDPASAAKCRAEVKELLLQLEVDRVLAAQLAQQWIQTGDYLLDLSKLPKADLVIGNPPYIRLEDVDDALLVEYRRRFSSMVGRADLYVAFFEAALTQLNPGGACAFICADRWMLNQYGAQLRQLITTKFSVETVIELHRAGTFASEVNAYPAITVIRARPQRPAIVARGDASVSEMGAAAIRQVLTQATAASGAPVKANGLKAAQVSEWFTSSQPWPCYNPDRLALLKYLEANFYPLDSKGTGTRSGIGVASGADAVFLTTDPNLVEPDRLLPMALAKDIRSGHLDWSGHYLINPWNGQGLVSLEKYPKLAAYLQQHESTLRQRHIGKRNPDKWYRTIDRVEAGLLGKPKLYIADIKERLNPVLDSGQTYPHHNLYFIQSAAWDHEVLGGLLLSDIAQFFIECYAVRMRGGYLRFQTQYLRRIRLPRPLDVSVSQAEGMKRAFQERDRELATKIAMQLYDITHIPEDDY